MESPSISYGKKFGFFQLFSRLIHESGRGMFVSTRFAKILANLSLFRFLNCVLPPR